MLRDRIHKKGIVRKFIYVEVVAVMISMLSGLASADPGTATVNSCSTDGLLFSASGTYSDNDGVIDVSIYANGMYRGGATFWPPKTSGVWSISNSAVPYGDEYTCITVTATITDVNNDTTTSGPCYAGVPERCWDGKENDCDGKIDCDDSDCNEQVCNREDYPFHWYCCGGSCVDTNTDPNNCGGCGNECPEDYWDCDGNDRVKWHCSCVGGSFYWEVIETDPCPEGKECVKLPGKDSTCEEVPEFPAGVTAVFGATLFIFLMMRRKYVRK